MGGDPQTPPWLRTFWHAVFPLGVVAFAMTNRPIRSDARLAAAFALGATITFVIAATSLATTYVSYLPKLIENTAFSATFIYNNYPAMVVFCGTIAALSCFLSSRDLVVSYGFLAWMPAEAT